MYVTRPLSMYIKSPDALSLPPPEGPSSGILVILDEEAEPTRCFGLCKTGYIKDLPFPQNKSLEHRYTTGIGFERDFHFQKVVFIPVLDQPLSSNRYYAIQPYGKHRGEAYTNSEEEEMPTCCFGGYVCDVTPRPLDPTNLNQQFMICRKGGIVNNWGGFVAKSLAPDGFPPFFLGVKGWKVCAEASPEFELGEAQGLDTTLRARLPEFNFSLSNTSSNPVVVGKWYCPFMFIKEGTPKSLKDEMSNLIYYEITLQQRWEQIFASENNNSQTQGNSVAVDALVKIEVVRVAGREAVIDERNVANGVLWFRSCSNVGEEASVALGLAVIERMKWEQERVGWIGETYGKQMRIERLEGFGGTGGWKRFGCYVLVESFVLKRLDGSLVLTYDFKHTHQIRSKWE
ncbi:uncharacterized protein LOC122308835 [Carya illinoinensis]|uniref:Insecticidal crystal toxin domain-containing protein n=1 Tax=Carya illinoinensis TaxID=32201 RepID=A0A8T1QHU2_CARIL|nr:uncharacterized protein LOC122308835 [Carya illinoinensis]KAG6654037.1 hypothetical protein CIPAW_05G118200 [Carya illinoinensis]